MKPEIMTHFVVGYPRLSASLEVGRALARAGAAYLEIQFPFSDPSADGPVIQQACTRALEAGFKVSQGWELVETLHKEFPGLPLFVMSYASLVVAAGVETFCTRAREAGASGLIIPDLTWGDDEGLYAAGARQGLAIVPVIVPTTPEARLRALLAEKPRYLYTALRVGITGRHTEISEDLKGFLNRLRQPGTKLLAGFGIDSPEQVSALRPYADALVIGSDLVRALGVPEGRSDQDLAAAVAFRFLQLLG